MVSLGACVAGSTSQTPSSYLRAVRLVERLDENAGADPAVVVRDEPLQDGDRVVRGRLYSASRGDHLSAVVLCHGIHHKGIDEPRLVRLARALAADGALVFTPELPELADYRLSERSIGTIGNAVRRLSSMVGRRVTLFGMSFAGGMALRVAASPTYRDGLGIVVAVGAHNDASRVLGFFTSGTIAAPDGTILSKEPHEYGPLVVLYDHVDEVFDPGDAAVARDAIRHWLHEDRATAKKRASEASDQGRALLERLFDHRRETATALLGAKGDLVRRRAGDVSPAGAMAGIDAKVFLLHGTDDAVIPPTETQWNARELGPRVDDALVTDAISHVELGHGPGVFAKLRLLQFLARVLESERAIK
jgi:dienelactone hydrolase